MIKIEKTNREFALLKWVLLAMAKDSSRYAINGVHFVDNQAVCTDGKRLHIGTFEHNTFEPGTYEVISNTAKMIVIGEPIDGNFPKYDDIVPVTDMKILEQSDGIHQFIRPFDNLHWPRANPCPVTYVYYIAYRQSWMSATLAQQLL